MSQAKRSKDDRSRFRSISNWGLPGPLEPALVERVSHDANVIPEVARILLRRSGNDAARALMMMARDRDAALPDLQLLPGISYAVKRLCTARERQERVAVYSDFDCDGITGAVILTECLELAGFENFLVYFPSRRTEGYGFHAGSATALSGDGASLFVTCDCGISGYDACEVLSSLGRDVIITDHHLPGTDLPKAVSIIDPHLPAWDGFGLTGLSGAGVAYLLSLALHRALGVETARSWAHDLLALSIAGDGQPVTGPNRAWIRSGLASMREEPRPGISALLRVAGLAQPGRPGVRSLSFDRDVAYGLVPRINAAGRLSDPRIAYDLLRTVDPLLAADLAAKIDSLNRRRKEIENRIVEECWEDLPVDAGAMCAFRPGWHEGVIGIACSRIREVTGRPVALVGGEGETLKGSVRGVSGYNVVSALRRCGKMLAAFGGHEAAGGFSIRKDMVADFFRAFDAVTSEMLETAGMRPPVPVDDVLTVDRITGGNLQSFFEMEPFGDGNPFPQVACMDCEVVHVSLMGSSLDHMQALLGKKDESQRFLWFGQGGLARDVALLGKVDVLFTPYRSVYRGEEQFSPLIKDMRPAWSESGLAYADLRAMLPADAPVILYTWSEHAARSMAVALRKAGRTAVVHVKGETGPGAGEARAALREGGVVASTAPWELSSPGNVAISVVKPVVVHRPLDPSDGEKLDVFLRSTGAPALVLDMREDALKWLRWTYPDKDRLRCMWKFLAKSFGARIAASDLGRRWAEALQAAGYPAMDCHLEGGRVFLQSAVDIFLQVGLLTYDVRRRVPEFVLRKDGERVDLNDSAAFRDGEEKRLWADEWTVTLNGEVKWRDSCE